MILVHNKNILAVNPIENDDSYVADDKIIPKHIVPDAILIDVALPTDFSLGKYNFENGEFVLNPVETKNKTEQEVQETLIAFMTEKNIESIGEANALLNSTNPEWVIEAKTVIRLWDETWQAFETGGALPALSWS